MSPETVTISYLEAITVCELLQDVRIAVLDDVPLRDTWVDEAWLLILSILEATNE